MKTLRIEFSLGFVCRKCFVSCLKRQNEFFFCFWKRKLQIYFCGILLECLYSSISYCNFKSMLHFHLKLCKHYIYLYLASTKLRVENRTRTYSSIFLTSVTQWTHLRMYHRIMWIFFSTGI